MIARRTLETARAAGIKIELDGTDLLLWAELQPPADVLDALSHHKAEVVALLRADKKRWDAEDWRAHFDERAGIAEFDGGLSRMQAEARAFQCCIVEWLNRNFVPSAPGRCAACGRLQGPDKLLPFGTNPIGHAWLHSRCWSAWDASRRAEAIAALAAIIERPAVEQVQHLIPAARPAPSIPREDDNVGRRRSA